MFIMRDNIVRAWRNLSRLELSERSRFIFSGYFGTEDHLGVVRDINDLVHPDVTCSYVLQDEPVTYGMGIVGADDEIVYDNVIGQLTSDVTFPKQEMLNSRLHIHAFFDTVQWRTWTAMAGDISLQRRFHGHMIALQACVPSIAIAIDDRMREMLKFIGFPYIEQDNWYMLDEKLGYLIDFIHDIDVDSVVDNYLERETAFQTKLAGCRLRLKLNETIILCSDP